MTTKCDRNSTDLHKTVSKIVEAALAGNRQRVELLTLTAIRSFQATVPDLAEELGAVLARTAQSGATRGAGTEPPPADVDGGLALVRFDALGVISNPIFADNVQGCVDRFLRERAAIEQLLRAGFVPPRSLLLKGPPGTGKTTLARFIAHRLGLRLIVLDLASAISSFLGKTGSNLRRIFDYARSGPCVLLLDEFDAIGKRRDDATEVGELKRIVNVLLKELEDWPPQSVLIAATNHPELLDPAIHRRFDVVIDIPLPTQREAVAILERAGGQISNEIPPGFLDTISSLLTGKSGSEIETLAIAVARRYILGERPASACFVNELMARTDTEFPKQKLGRLIAVLHEAGMSVREIASMLGKGASTVQYHLKKEANHARKPTKTDTR